jgi:hypothetical protein
MQNPLIFVRAATRFKINSKLFLLIFIQDREVKTRSSTAPYPSDQASLAFFVSATLVSLNAN